MSAFFHSEFYQGPRNVLLNYWLVPLVLLSLSAGTQQEAARAYDLAALQPQGRARRRRGTVAARPAAAGRRTGRLLAGELGGGGGQGAGRGRPAARVPTAAPWNLQGRRRKLEIEGGCTGRPSNDGGGANTSVRESTRYG